MAATPDKTGQVPDVQALLEVDRVIHEPARLAIVSVLAACEAADFVYLRHATGMTQGNLSTHLSKLEEAGYIKIEKRFQGKKPNTLCSLTGSGRTAFDQYRARVAKFVR